MLKRLNDLSRTDAAKIRKRQIVGTMKVYFDNNNYICYDTDELKAYEPRKKGRPHKKEAK